MGSLFIVVYLLAVAYAATRRNATRAFVVLLALSASGCDGCSPASSPGPLRPDQSTRFHIADRLGSNALVLDIDGDVISRQAYEPYGERWVDWRAGADEAPAYGYTGKERDAISGAVAIGARHYLPTLGRWASPDPLVALTAGFALASPEEANPFAYVGGGPVDEIDPTGYCRRCARLGLALGRWLQQGVQAPLAARGNSIARQAGPRLRRAYRAASSALDAADRALTQVELAMISAGPPGVAAAGVEAGTLHAAVRGARLLMRAAEPTRRAARTLRMPKAVGADVKRVRLRHYTKKSTLKSIEKDNVLKASDRFGVFATSAKKKPMSATDARAQLRIKGGKGGAYVEFDAAPGEFTIETVQKTGAREYIFRGNVDLSGRNPTFHRNN